MYTNTVPALLSKNVGNTLTNYKTWGGIIYNVKEGKNAAKGDGVTDDTTAIQDTINLAMQTGGVVYFPDGVYMVSQLTINKSVHMYSMGNATIKQIPFSGNLLNISGTGLEVWIDNLTFDGNYTAQSTSSMNYTINISGVGAPNDPFVFYAENCIFLNQCFTSVFARGDLSSAGMEHYYFTDCQFLSGSEGTPTYDPRYITVVDGANFTITDCIFDLLKTPTANGISGIFISTTDTANPFYSSVTIVNNTFRNCGRNASNALGVIDFYTFAENTLIQGNKFYNSIWSPIKGKTNSKSIIVADNFVDGSGSSPGININPATYGTTQDNFIIRNNIVRNAGGHGITVDALDSDNVGRLEVIGNIVDTCSGSGIYVIRAGSAVVSQNIVYNATSLGIHLTRSAGEFDVSDNIVAVTGSFGIYIDTNVTGVKAIIAHNQIKSPTRYGIYANQVTSLTIQGNIIDGVILSSSQVGIIFGNVTGAAIVTGNQVLNSGTTPLSVLGGPSTVADYVEWGNGWNGSNFYGAAAPTTGTWAVGDKVWNAAPAAGGYIGWVCTTTGTPGTWKGFGAIQA
ncbi:hypothetical protein PN4B1_17060 [Paenibacillus naphthalenovorans]|uniref:right-handed parallel beta-helix repeat-containing protein n=1 Tax=Paenibacillus naphthalenovorans TaxID=162209 RepID=UPI0010B0C8F6|nr:right-handed parallel beta-helix repeat-containing protein [Paenibacillus naphthalenovorans]GCL71801.1 hypothetical protein PN4B1_17060 [Paenibacillus naphthalenovorans]